MQFQSAKNAPPATLPRWHPPMSLQLSSRPPGSPCRGNNATHLHMPCLWPWDRPRTLDHHMYRHLLAGCPPSELSRVLLLPLNPNELGLEVWRFSPPQLHVQRGPPVCPPCLRSTKNFGRSRVLLAAIARLGQSPHNTPRLDTFLRTLPWGNQDRFSAPRKSTPVSSQCLCNQWGGTCGLPSAHLSLPAAVPTPHLAASLPKVAGLRPSRK